MSVFKGLAQFKKVIFTILIIVTQTFLVYAVQAEEIKHEVEFEEIQSKFSNVKPGDDSFFWYEVQKNENIGTILHKLNISPLWGRNGNVKKTELLNSELLLQVNGKLDKGHWIKIPLRNRTQPGEADWTLYSVKINTKEVVGANYFEYEVQFGETISSILNKFRIKPLWGPEGYVKKTERMNSEFLTTVEKKLDQNYWIKIPIPDEKTYAQLILRAEERVRRVASANLPTTETETAVTTTSTSVTTTTTTSTRSTTSTTTTVFRAASSTSTTILPASTTTVVSAISEINPAASSADLVSESTLVSNVKTPSSTTSTTRFTTQFELSDRNYGRDYQPPTEISDNYRPPDIESGAIDNGIRNGNDFYFWYRIKDKDTIGSILYRFNIGPLWGPRRFVEITTKLNEGRVKKNGHEIAIGQWIRIPIPSEDWHSPIEILGRQQTEDETKKIQEIDEKIGAVQLKTRQEMQSIPDEGKLKPTALPLSNQNFEPIGEQKNDQNKGQLKESFNGQSEQLMAEQKVDSVIESFKRANASEGEPGECREPADLLDPMTQQRLEEYEKLKRIPQAINVLETESYYDSFGTLEASTSMKLVRLDARDTVRNSKGVFSSDIASDLHLQWKRHVMARYTAILDFNMQYLSIKAPAGREFKLPTKFYNSYALGMSYDFEPKLAFFVMGGLVEKPYLSYITEREVKFVKGQTPFFDLGSRYDVIFYGPISVSFEGAFRIYLPSSSEGTEIKTGFGGYVKGEERIVIDEKSVLGVSFRVDGSSHATTRAKQTELTATGAVFWIWKPDF